MSARRLTLATVAWLSALTGVLALMGAPAQAVVFHRYESQITEVPASLSAPVAGPLRDVDRMTDFDGDLYVAERLDGQVPGTNFRADEFAPSIAKPGEYEFAAQLPQQYDGSYAGIALGVSTGETEMYLGGERPAGVAVFGIGLCGTLECPSLQETWTGASTPTGSFGEVRDVAVDDSSSPEDWARGDVFVVDSDNDVIDVFKPQAGGKEPSAMEAQITGTSPSEPFPFVDAIAVSGFNGDVIVPGNGKVADVFKPEEEKGTRKFTFVQELAPPGGIPMIEGIEDVAVDGGDGEIYVATNSTVYEFGPEGEYRGKITGEETPEKKWSYESSHTPEGLAVDPLSHRVFVGVFKSSREDGLIDVFSPDLVVPDVETEPASDEKTERTDVQAEPATDTWSAQLNGTVNPDKAGPGTCLFEWGATTELGQVVECAEPVGEGEAAVAVQATLHELEPDTTYYYRLGATNTNGTNRGEPLQNQHFTTPGPGLHGDAPADIAAESATLTATVDPHGAATSYYFQYGTTAAYGSDAPVLDESVPNGALAGSAEGDLEVDQHLQGLLPDTLYHFRVVEVSELGGRLEAFASADQTFTTQRAKSSLTLPDGRQWEMVTPPHKEGALFSPISEGTLIQASANGDAIADLAASPTEAEPAGYANAVTVLSTRGATGWSSQVIAPPHDESTGASVGQGQEYRFFSEDLSLGAVQPFGNFIALSPEASESTAYLRSDYMGGDVSDHCEGSYLSPSSCLHPLVTAANTPPGTMFGEELNGECTKFICGPQFEGASPDLSHVVLSSTAQLTDTPNGGQGLYEWSAGELRLVSLLPEAEGGAAAAAPQLGQQDEAARHAISDDGSRVIWEGSSHLYLRDTSKGETVRIDALQGGESKSFEPEPVYMTASSDGSRIFFLDKGRLTAESSEGGEDLYEYNLNAPAGERLTDLTVDKRFEENANVLNVLGASEDGSYVYFVATGVLTPNAHAGDNLYVHHDGETTLIAALSQEDYPDWGNGVSSLSHMTARVSPDGNWLAFMSNRDLTGFDTQDAASGRPDEEVYLYNASANHLLCASCNPTGARPVGVEYRDLNLAGGDRVWGETTWLAANIPGWTPYRLSGALYQSRYLFDSGRLFFNSNDALVPQDVNGTEDIYEYEPADVGSCTEAAETFSERAGGCVGLISSGASSGESAFLDASTTGDDVFFLTTAKLSGQDFDTSRDVYDAHVCTTPAPCYPVAPVAPPACTTGDACKPAPTPQPSIFGAPASATFSGTGNVPYQSAKAPVKQTPGPKPKPLTRAQKLKRALTACRRKGHVQRVVCERKARRRYGSKRPAKANVKKGER